jgi:hypothetical protein
MTPNEQTLLAKLLDMASDEFANHGCNDFPLPNTDENWALYVAMEQRLDPGGWKMYPQERPPLDNPIYFMDWMLMRYFQERAEKGTL